MTAFPQGRGDGPAPSLDQDTGDSCASRSSSSAAFTLIEILLASVAAAMILVVINAIFVRAIHLRDNATERVRTTRLRVRAERAIRDDLQSALVSGGILASTLYGGSTSTGGPGGASFPGYLKLTTTNGRSAGGAVASDVQQVEYYVVRDPNATGESASNRGMLVRAVTRDLLASTTAVSKEETVLNGMQSLGVEFYDGTSWVSSWEFDSDTAAASASTDGTTITTGNATLPDAIRVSAHLLPAKPGGPTPPPVEVLVPWTTQSFVGATPAPVSASQQQQQQQQSVTPPPGPPGPLGPGDDGPPSGPQQPRPPRQ